MSEKKLAEDDELLGCIAIIIIIGIVALFAIYYIPIYLSSVLIFVIVNLFVLLLNAFILLFNGIKFVWYQSEILFTYVDRLLFILPFSPVISWLLLGLIISVPISYFIATKSVRKPILLQKLLLLSLPIISILILYAVTKGKNDPEKYLLEKINKAESTEQIINYYNTLIKLNPKPDYYLARAQYYEKIEKFENALNDYKKLNSIIPKDDERQNLIKYKITDLNRKIGNIEPPPKPKEQLTEEKQKIEPPPKPKKQLIGIITASNVNLRDNYTFNSNVIQKLNINEEVIILDKKISTNPSEAITKYEIKVKSSIGPITLNKGKFLNIIAESPDQYIVSFKYNNSEITTNIPASAVEKTSGNYWYKIKTKNGKIGWVYGKFISEK